MSKATKQDYKFLNNIDTPKDIKKLSSDELKFLCEEVRSFMIDKVSKTGGHLGASLQLIPLLLVQHQGVHLF